MAQLGRDTEATRSTPGPWPSWFQAVLHPNYGRNKILPGFRLMAADRLHVWWHVPAMTLISSPLKAKAQPSQAHQGKSDGLINIAADYTLGIRLRQRYRSWVARTVLWWIALAP